jgi:hypothetical protein
MPKAPGLRISPLWGALFAIAFSGSVAFASGSGSDHDEDAADVSDVGAGDQDNSGPSGGDDMSDHDSPSGDDDASGGASDWGDGSGGDDESGNSESGGGEDDDGGSSGGGGSDNGDDDDDGASGGSGSGSSGSGNSGSGDDDDASSNSGSGSSGSSGSSHSGSASASEPSANASGHDVQAISVEHDEAGEERAVGEALLTGTHHDIALAREAGFRPISETPLATLDCAIARLAIPVGMSVEQAIAVLHAIAPNALVTPNSIYRSSQAFIAPSRAASAARALAPFVGVLGIIDTGVSTRAMERPAGVLSQRAFAGQAPVARAHGSAVAALAMSQGMRVHVADVFGSSADGALVASAESIAAALDWMIENNVPVINVSIEGPGNAILAELVRHATQRGHVIVAAAGNGGPLARPAFPAAFAGSVAVTAIDGNDRPYMRANRGGYIAFAARGVNLSVGAGDDQHTVSGTSFAAPLVAAQIAARLHIPSAARARIVLEDLQARAIDLGAPGRDPIFGWGALRN